MYRLCITPSQRNRQVYNYSKNACPKVNVITRLEFELTSSILAYYSIQNVSHNAAETSPSPWQKTNLKLDADYSCPIYTAEKRRCDHSLFPDKFLGLPTLLSRVSVSPLFSWRTFFVSSSNTCDSCIALGLVALFHAFPKSITAMWNAISLVQDYVHFRTNTLGKGMNLCRLLHSHIHEYGHAQNEWNIMLITIEHIKNIGIPKFENT